MAIEGTAIVDFGAFPGASDTKLDVTGQTGILATSRVEAWIRIQASANHTADEHWVESINVRAGNIVAGVGFTIYAWNTNQLNEPVLPRRGRGPTSISPNPTIAGQLQSAQGVQVSSTGGRGTRLYGTFNVDWVWN